MIIEDIEIIFRQWFYDHYEWAGTCLDSEPDKIDFINRINSYLSSADTKPRGSEGIKLVTSNDLHVNRDKTAEDIHSRVTQDDKGTAFEKSSDKTEGRNEQRYRIL